MMEILYVNASENQLVTAHLKGQQQNEHVLLRQEMESPNDNNMRHGYITKTT